ncbi:MAG: sporulation protein YtfJ [Clostridia bacterium]|nr:sporulation protein YtfJ [Clostridia bacterium]
MAETKVSGIIANALEDIRTVVDANTIIGTPIETNSGTTIIPVSKVSMGIASGGVDYESKKTAGNNNFGGGGGSGVSVVPVAFLVVHADGSVEMMNVSNPTSKPADLGYNVSSLVERAPEIIEKIKAMIPKKKKKDESAADEAPAVSEEQTEEAKDASEEEEEHEFLDTSL